MSNKSGLLTKLIYGGILMSTKQKTTWADIFNNFKAVYPNLSKGAVDYKAYAPMTIMVRFSDGSLMKYDDGKKMAKTVYNPK